MKIGIIGGGRVGLCLAEYLHENLVAITASTTSKNEVLAQRFQTECCTNESLVKKAEVILITVPDRKIEPIATELANSLTVQGKVFLHCSGSLTLEPLMALQNAGAYIGSLHPLQSFSGGKTNLKGVYMAIDGKGKAVTTAQKIVELLQGHSFCVPAEERAAYHAAACICSNYAVTVEALAQRLMSRWLGNEASAWQALLPLFRGTFSNIQETISPAKALTGPIARGDIITIQKHLQVLPQEYLNAYCSLGYETTNLAFASGAIDGNTAQQLEAIFKTAQNKEI